MLKKIAASPYLNFLSGIILLLTAGYEVWHTIETANLGSHHGILIFGLVQIIKSIPEIFRGVDEVEKSLS